MRKFTCLFLMLIAGLSPAQTSFFTNEFYVPVTDSLLWKSPLTPGQVMKETIKQVVIDEKKWVRTCDRCPDHPTPDMVKTVHLKTVITFRYDSLGYPVKIVVKEQRGKKEMQVYVCTNTYDRNSRLIKSQLWFSDPAKNKLVLRDSYYRSYNESGVMDTSRVYDFDKLLMQQHVYNYNVVGAMIQFDNYPRNGNGVELNRRYKFIYNKDNKLINMLTLSKQDVAGGEQTGSRQSLLYDHAGRDSVVYYGFFADTLWKQKRIDLAAGATGTIIARYNSSASTEGELGWARKVKGDKIYNWRYNYDLKRIEVTCFVEDGKTGLPLYIKKNHAQIKKPKYIRSNGIKSPKKPFGIKFLHRSDITKYVYTR